MRWEIDGETVLETTVDEDIISAYMQTLQGLDSDPKMLLEIKLGGCHHFDCFAREAAKMAGGEEAVTSRLKEIVEAQNGVVTKYHGKTVKVYSGDGEVNEMVVPDVPEWAKEKNPESVPEEIEPAHIGIAQQVAAVFGDEIGFNIPGYL